MCDSIYSQEKGDGNSLLYGTEYQENILAPDSADEDVPCAVCRSTTTQTSIMIPGRETCYPGWKKEYNGLIASTRNRKPFVNLTLLNQYNKYFIWNKQHS
jgi:hypothetical protein